MFLFKGAGLEKKTFLAKVVGTFNKVKEKKRNRAQEHPGNTRETPRRGAFTNVFIQRSRFTLGKVQMEFRDNYANLWSSVANWTIFEFL